MLLIKRKSHEERDEEFLKILESSQFQRYFSVGNVSSIPIFTGERLLSIKSNFKEGANYGKTPRPEENFWPVGSLAHVLYTTGTDSFGGYSVKAIKQRYELSLTSEGLVHRMILNERNGSRGASGPDADYENRLRREIFWHDFENDGATLLLNKSEKNSSLKLDSSLDSISFYSGLSERAINREMRYIERICMNPLVKEIYPRKIKNFREINWEEIDSGKLEGIGN